MNELLNVFWQGENVVAVERGGRLRRHRAEFSCFIRADQLTHGVARQLRSSAGVRGFSREGPWVRIRWRDERTRRRGCEWLETEAKVPTYEGGTSPVQRWLADNRPVPARPRRCYLDLETDSRIPFSRKAEMRILCWCLIDGDTGEATLSVLGSDSDEAERHLLEGLWKQLEAYDQVIAWNGDRFDFPVIRARTKHVGLDVEPRRWLWLDQMVLYERMNRMAAESGDEKQSLKLDSVAQVLLGEGKHDFDASKTWEAWEGDKCAEMLRYCEQDTRLLLKIEEKTGYVELLQTICEVCGTFADTSGAGPMRYVESFLLRLAAERGEKLRTHFPSEYDKYQGALVLEPRWRGITKNVHVADFSGMYPSIILSWNMSPEVKRERPDPLAGMPAYLRGSPAWQKAEEESKRRPEGCCEAPLTHVLFATEPRGLLPTAVEELIRRRKEWSEKKARATPGTPEWKEADRRSTAYKVAVNGFYGVAGSSTSQFFDREVAESVSTTGVWLIQETIRAAEAREFDVGYADTDGAYVTRCTQSEFGEFVDWCNADLYPGLLVAQGCREQRVQLAYEKAFERIVFTTAKRYTARFAHYKGTPATDDSEPEVKGLEYKRGDTVRLARQLQKQVVDLLCKERCEDVGRFHALAAEWQARVLTGEIGVLDAMLSKRLSQSLKDYVVRKKKDGTPAAEPPHVAIARVLKERGHDVGEGAKIEYIVVDGASRPQKAIPAIDWTGDCDRHALWEDHTWPPTERLLSAAFPAEDWAKWGSTRPAKQVRVPSGQVSLWAEEAPKRRTRARGIIGS